MMNLGRATFLVGMLITGSSVLADEVALVPLDELAQKDLTTVIAIERCAAFYAAMKTRGLENGLSEGILSTVDTVGQRVRVMALSESPDDASGVENRIDRYTSAYLVDFRQTDTEINLINSPNPLFQSDRAVCRDLFF